MNTCKLWQADLHGIHNDLKRHVPTQATRHFFIISAKSISTQSQFPNPEQFHCNNRWNPTKICTNSSTLEPDNATHKPYITAVFAHNFSLANNKSRKFLITCLTSNAYVGGPPTRRGNVHLSTKTPHGGKSPVDEIYRLIDHSTGDVETSHTAARQCGILFKFSRYRPARGGGKHGQEIGTW